MRRPAALLVALATILLAVAPAPAPAAPGKLRATIAQATPTPQGQELSDDPGLPDGDASDEATGGGSDDESAGDADLPATGAEPLLVALMGLGLLGTGLGIRRRTADAGSRA